MTYRGHAVLQTLIRCHFSPSETTGGRYIYSGSADGRIHVRLSLVGSLLTSTHPIWWLLGLVARRPGSPDPGPEKNTSYAVKPIRVGGRKIQYPVQGRMRSRCELAH
jgi:hypothetical protein